MGGNVIPARGYSGVLQPQELVDTRYLDEMEKSGFFDQLWVKK